MIKFFALFNTFEENLNNLSLFPLAADGLDSFEVSYLIDAKIFPLRRFFKLLDIQDVLFTYLLDVLQVSNLVKNGIAFSTTLPSARVFQTSLFPFFY